MATPRKKPELETRIRDALIFHLWNKSMRIPNVLYVPELALKRTRADLAVVRAGSLHGYEIKSGNDTLTRLSDQVVEYSQAFDWCWCVVHPKHLEKSAAALPPFWGILCTVEKEDNSIDFLTVREASYSPEVSALTIASHLWLPEVKLALKTLGADPKTYSRSTRARATKTLADMYPTKIRALVYGFMSLRPNWQDFSSNDAYRYRKTLQLNRNKDKTFEFLEDLKHG